MKKLTTIILGTVLTIGLTGLGFAQTTPDTGKDKTETTKTKKKSSNRKGKKSTKTTTESTTTTTPAK